MAVVLILFSSSSISHIHLVSAEDPVEQWALIVSASSDRLDFSNNAQYMYHVLTDHYAFDGICYLDVIPNRPGVSNSSTLANVRWAITSWLGSRADGNDIVFIYISSHGGGYNSIEQQRQGGRFDANGDEGNELNEATLGQDINGDGDVIDWVGIDECTWIGNVEYWDDDLANDLNSITCGTLVLVRQGCLEGNQSCFSGGLIDDVSAANRIIMSASNETYYSMGDIDADGLPGDGYSEWTEAFVDALHYERTYYDATSNSVVHTGIPVHADSNEDGNVTLFEAWTYAWNNDEARIAGQETPWFDDNGNGLPTFINGADQLDPNDGALAGQVCLEPSLPKVLRKLGFTNISESTIETFPPNHNNLNATLYVELAGFHDQNELSWYHVNTSEYHLLFSGPEGGDGFLENPVSKTFAVNDEFGLSFLSPEHRYFTETNKNGDGMKHAKVYVNMDNQKMFLIGFENLFGGGDRDYDDMVISLEISDSSPNSPTLSGTTSGYVYSEYKYSANATDPNVGDHIQYEFVWGDGTSNTTTNFLDSGVHANASHIFARPNIFDVRVKARDEYGEFSWSDPLLVTIRQNDANTGGDAGNDFNNATYISWSTPTYWGTLYASNSTDTDDFYKSYVYSGQSMYLSMTPPPGTDFELELYSPANVLKRFSYNGAGVTEEISYTADSSGYWRAAIFAWYGEGQYSFFWGSAPPGGGGDPCPTLFAWNNTAYVDEGIMNIHNPSGEDVLHEALIEEEDVSITNCKATFRLREGWLGLNFSKSVIDQARLYAVDSYGNRYLCPLMNATHSRLGNVWLQLLFSDNWKTNLLLLETIDLTFLMPYQNVQSYVFVIEGCNQYKQ